MRRVTSVTNRMKVKSPARSELKELVDSIGGPDSVRAILEDFYQRMSKDILIGFFFDGKDLKHIAYQQANFILNAAGILDRFEGKGPSTAHVALAPILTGHFDRRLVILRQTLEAHKIPQICINSWVQFEEGFRSIVVSD